MALSLASLLDFFKEKPKLIQKGEDALKSNHLQDIRVKSSAENGTTLVEAVVLRSMRPGTYDVKLTLKNAIIVSSFCECAVGQMFCHHIACVALFVRDNVSSTGVLCAWKRPTNSTGELVIQTGQ